MATIHLQHLCIISNSMQSPLECNGKSPVMLHGNRKTSSFMTERPMCNIHIRHRRCVTGKTLTVCLRSASSRAA